MTPNRITAAGTALLGIALALAALLADLDAPLQVTALVAGAVTVLTPAVLWLRGWQAWEARQGEADEPVDLEDLREAVRLLLARGTAGPVVPPAYPSEAGGTIRVVTMGGDSYAIPDPSATWPEDEGPEFAEGVRLDGPADADPLLRRLPGEDPDFWTPLPDSPDSLPAEERGAP